MNFNEAVASAKARPNTRYIALNLHRTWPWLERFEILAGDQDDPERIIFFYEGGNLFGFEHEEYFFDLALDVVPKVARQLDYLAAELLPDISGRTAEYALYLLFPALPDPDTVIGPVAERAYYEKAKKLIAEL